jgi:hypothetical protein
VSQVERPILQDTSPGTRRRHDSVVRIGGGQGAFGESPELLRSSFEAGVDYVVCDSLAETTCGMFALVQQRDESLGWAPDLLARLDVALPYVSAQGTRLITNAGGCNPIAAHQRAVAHARAAGCAGLRIAVVHHDPPPRPEPAAAGTLASIVYAGADGIVRALADGADVVITGRVADAALFLAPLIHEFGWSWDDWDRLAAGTTVGHLLECSGQVVGGNYSGDWWNFLDYPTLGSPIAEVDADGRATITKPAGTSGRVSFDTVREQLLYEVHDPRCYVTPDVVVDLASVTLDDDGHDRVRVSGARGAPRPAELKALRYGIAGYTAEVVLTFAWPDAEAKCRHVLRSLRDLAEREGIAVQEWHEELFGLGGFGGPTLDPSDRPGDPPEVTARLAWRTATADDAAAVQALVPRIVLFSPAGLQGIGRRGRERAGPAPLLRVEPFLVDRAVVEESAHVLVEEVSA